MIIDINKDRKEEKRFTIEVNGISVDLDKCEDVNLLRLCLRMAMENQIKTEREELKSILLDVISSINKEVISISSHLDSKKDLLGEESEKLLSTHLININNILENLLTITKEDFEEEEPDKDLN